MWKYKVGSRTHLLRGSVEMKIYNHLLVMDGASWSNEIIQHIGNGKNPYLNRMVAKGIIKQVNAHGNDTVFRRSNIITQVEHDRLVRAIRRTTYDTYRTYWIIAGDI